MFGGAVRAGSCGGGGDGGLVSFVRYSTTGGLTYDLN